MKIPIKLYNGVFTFVKPEQAKSLVNGSIYMLEVHKQRSIKQNSALHKYFSLLAYELNSIGAYCNIMDNEVMWSDLLVKELIWRPMQKVLLNKTSTTSLTTEEVNKIYEKVSELIFSKYEFTLPFPQEEIK